MQLAARLPVRQRIAALGEAILVVPASQRDEVALKLIELAGFDLTGSACGHGTDLQRHELESAAGPIELLARIPQRWQGRHAHEAMRALARAWGVLSRPMRELGAGLGRHRWLVTAEGLARDADPHARLAALSIAHDTADPGFAKIAGMLLVDEDRSVRQSADRTIMRLTMVMLEHLPAHLLGEDLAKVAATPRVVLPADPAVLALERCTLLGTIADAAWSFASHRCRSPLLAALLVMDRGVATPMERELCARMRRLLSERNHPSHSPLRTVLRRTPCPILRERALRWLTIAPISAAAVDRLGIAESVDEHELVLGKSYLGIRPKRADRLKSLHHATHRSDGRVELVEQGPLPRREAIAELSEEARAGLVRMASQIMIDDQPRRDLLEPMLADPSVRVRLGACVMSPPIDLPDFLYDADPSVARTGALIWSSSGQKPPRPFSPAWNHRKQIAQTNVRSPHPWVRRVSGEEFDRLSMIRPFSPASRVQARRMYQTDPSAFVRMLRDHLADPDSRCNALMLIRILGIGHRFELDLIAIVQNESCDARSRATAVMALGEVKTTSASYMLSEALQDRDDRIRSNAVESIAGPVDQLFELKADDHHRVRASAIRRMIRESDPAEPARSHDAARALLEMLHDDRPMHRLAGTWAAQRTLVGDSRAVMGSVWKPLIGEIELLASGGGASSERADGPELGQIRSRAQRCIHRIGCDLELQHQRQVQSIHAPGADWSGADWSDGCSFGSQAGR